jgi:quercetin dioxygenase-like cupin family protein
LRNYVSISALIIFCISIQALSEMDNSSSAAAPMSNTSSANLINESAVPFTIVNMTKLGEDHPVSPGGGFNISQAASGDHASTNLVQAPPGAVLKMHYHRYRDEVAYIIKGEAVFTLSGMNYTARAGDLIFIPAMTLHRVVATGNETFQVASTFAPPFDGKDRIYVEP